MTLKLPTNDPAAVAEEVQAVYLLMFPDGDAQFIPKSFQWTTDVFTGRYPGYQAVDAHYHDLEHTLQGTLCMARILRGRFLAKPSLTLPRRVVELGILAILLHDTGYLKKTGDAGGTGAKYTAVHVARSADFAAELLGENKFDAREIASVQNMICCTGVDALLKVIPFQSDAERIIGLCLGAADLLGQMAADDYIEKLPVLYSEFSEAIRSSIQKNNVVSMFSSARDLLNKTPDFWEHYVKTKLDRDFGGQHRYLNDPFPAGPNLYMEKIEANVRKLRILIASEADTTQFLKRYRYV
ncbi:MAG TPA: hypothetical protein VGN23_04795 [Verrucomicrobiae bacterium]|jgi:predicted metal-dependent HD superfamily phosphohydrolase